MNKKYKKIIYINIYINLYNVFYIIIFKNARNIKSTLYIECFYFYQ